MHERVHATNITTSTTLKPPICLKVTPQDCVPLGIVPTVGVTVKGYKQLIHIDKVTPVCYTYLSVRELGESLKEGPEWHLALESD